MPWSAQRQPSGWTVWHRAVDTTGWASPWQAVAGHIQAAAAEPLSRAEAVEIAAGLALALPDAVLRVRPAAAGRPADDTPQTPLIR